MFTYKKTPYKIFALNPKFCWVGPVEKTSPAYEVVINLPKKV